MPIKTARKLTFMISSSSAKRKIDDRLVGSANSGIVELKRDRADVLLGLGNHGANFFFVRSTSTTICAAPFVARATSQLGGFAQAVLICGQLPMTVAPDRARRSAVARPIPDPAPGHDPGASIEIRTRLGLLRFILLAIRRSGQTTASAPGAF